MKIQAGEREYTGTLTITADEQGNLSGMWKSSRGERKVSDVKYQDRKLTFTRVIEREGNRMELAFEGTVDLPSIITKDLWVTTSVPDKGTALLGGQRTVDEFETEVGVPILSKIPYINRFFTNRVTSTEEVTLLILLRPEIIIQSENEDLLFPGLLDAVGSGMNYSMP